MEDVLYKIPLCSSTPGNVGWIDWTPPSGGMNELAECISDPENTPGCTDPITVPDWYYVTQTGNTSDNNTVSRRCLALDGHVVLLPLFDDTCKTEPVSGNCGGGNGQQNWYHFVAVGAFQLCGPPVDGQEPIPGCTEHGAYVNPSVGGNDVCETEGNGATSCLVGRFVKMYTDTTVDPLYEAGHFDYPSPTTSSGSS